MLATLQAQERNLERGVWLYRVSCFEPWALPAEFNDALFRQSLSNFQGTPSFAGIPPATVARTRAEDLPTSQMVLLGRYHSELVSVMK